VGYGYTIFVNDEAVTEWCSSLSSCTHIFDAEAIGALRGLEIARTMGYREIWSCVDSTSGTQAKRSPVVSLGLPLLPQSLRG
jgi:hypothetical protein